MEQEDAFIRCPYYRYEGEQSVHCEGVQKGNGLRMGFATRRQKYKYKSRLCQKDWGKCFIATMLNAIYDYTP